MMKIRKAVLNEFTVSPVQFTSLNSVLFRNVKPVYDNSEIYLEYEHQCKIPVSLRDWIGIFPHGWSTLQQYVTFEWVSRSTTCGGSEQNKENDGQTIRRSITFNPKYHMNIVNENCSYQFVYVSKQIEVLGVSSYFRFEVLPRTESSVELECLVPVSSKIRSTSISDFGNLVNESSTTSLDAQTVQVSSIHSLQNLDGDNKSNWNKTQQPLNMTDSNKYPFLNRNVSVASATGDALNPYSSHSEPGFPMGLQTRQCKKCFQFRKSGEHVLQSKLKIVMERNKVLEERSQEIKKKLDKLQADTKRIKTSFYNVNKEKVAYEKFVKDFIKSLEKDSIVRVVNGNTEILVKKVNYVGMEEHPRDKKTSKRERELKAVIGLQEITIRNLINSLQEKAKSAEELKQTVKLAQAFSAAREESREGASDAEDSTDISSNSDRSEVTSEFEFSLSKPQPPEEVAADTDGVLEDIRRTTELELKNIGINRSFCQTSSEESVLDVTSLSVVSCREKEGRDIEDKLDKDECWPFAQGHSSLQEKTERPIRDRCGQTLCQQAEDNNSEHTEDVLVPTEATDWTLPSASRMGMEVDLDAASCDDFYDATDALSVRNCDLTSEECSTEEQRKQDVKEKPEGFSLTAIIPRNLNLTSLEECVEPEDVQDVEDVQKEKDPEQEKAKKFTCELSIDFAPKRPQSAEGCHRSQIGESDADVESSCQQVLSLDQLNPVAVVGSEQQVFSLKREKSFITFKQSNKCLQIKITHDPIETTSKSCIQQKMVVKFAGGSQSKRERPEAVEGEQEEVEEQTCGEAKKHKFEFNLAVTGLGDNKSLQKESSRLVTESDNLGSGDCLEKNTLEKMDSVDYLGKDQPEKQEDSDEQEEVEKMEQEIKEDEEQEEEKVDRQQQNLQDALESTDDKLLSPRTVWNDACDAPDADLDGSVENEKEAIEEPFPQDSDDVDADTCKSEELPKIESDFLSSKFDTDMLSNDSINNLKLYQDSLRYEKNLEFLQNKAENPKEPVDAKDTKEKPSAILIQNGQTKVAVIRYQ